MDPMEILMALRQRMTQRRIADALGVHEVTVSRWLAGTRAIRDWRHVQGLQQLHADELGREKAKRES